MLESAPRRVTTVWGDEHDAVDAAVRWAMHRVVRPSNPKATARPAAELAAAAGDTITPDGIGAEEALRVFAEVLEPATRAQDDPMNLAYIPAAPTRAAVAFDQVISSANIFGGLWEAGAGAIWAENQALRWIADLLGWGPETMGCFVSGGTVGNLSALAAARHRALTRRGSRPTEGWQVACSAGAHSSIAAAARILDVEVVDVPEDERGHLTGAALRKTVTDTGRVFAVVASAGTTNAGVVDDLDAIADFCDEHRIWLHVDGAYGGAGLVSATLRPQYAGIERADSFIVDPHKWLFAPYDCCALLYQHGAAATEAHAQHASYLDQVDRDAANPADLAIHLSRRARGLSLWFSLATHGTDRYAAAVDRTVAIAREVAEGIEETPHLRLLKAPELTVMLFERPGWSADDYRRWSDDLAKAGVMLCVPTQWDGRPVLRLAFVNPETDPQQVLTVLRETLTPADYVSP
jgi:glutamate/tyrosine decarboxylase-like PLP-dependent enzyme